MASEFCEEWTRYKETNRPPAFRMTGINGRRMRPRTASEDREYDRLASGVLKGVPGAIYAFLDRFGGERWKK